VIQPIPIGFLNQVIVETHRSSSLPVLIVAPIIMKNGFSIEEKYDSGLIAVKIK
jgi:hypothetical protein